MVNIKEILLVEDNPDDQALTIRALKKNNIINKVIIAEDGVAALDYLFGTGIYSDRDLSNKPTIVILDLKLPKVDGFEVLKRLRADESSKSIPVIILSSSKEEIDIVNAYNLGANSFIRKPVEFEKFTEAVKQLGIYWLLLNEIP
jgi:two-component system response regulator